MSTQSDFRAPSYSGRFFNRLFGFFVGLGLAFSYSYLLQVRGRKSGKIYSTPVSLLELNGNKYLVAPRGRTQWVRNAEASGEVSLKRRRNVQRFLLQPISGTEKLEVLKAYLDRFRFAVQGFFPVPAGSPVESFQNIAADYPAFKLSPL